MLLFTGEKKKKKDGRNIYTLAYLTDLLKAMFNIILRVVYVAPVFNFFTTPLHTKVRTHN